MTRRVWIAGLAGLAGLVLGMAACTAPPGAGPAAPPAATADAREQALRHARCMREHGVPEADPVVNAEGGLRIGGGYDKGQIDAEVLAAAMAACRPYEPVLSPEDRSAKLDAAREESRCMRAHGVEDFPDPEPDLDRDVPESIRLDPQFDEAEAACIRHGGRSPAPSR
ncbi:hypothetical protein KZZ52_45815 [Dactylosporangium sp. AC04546]|uniref:hypothetical protein n=1 Tax=Dactylosporangium sp. AC04546 TaxID=2862460 RepID=UPI001EDF092A|nr:hypothetical protein [Dactylosporangium sp. AC04546]WVK81234.1 hypothetical protein KZZ52_45815 [Dactylosporangium sp. AC04546]